MIFAVLCIVPGYDAGNVCENTGGELCALFRFSVAGGGKRGAAERFKAVPVRPHGAEKFRKRAEFFLKTERSDRGKGINQHRQARQRESVRMVAGAAAGIVAAFFEAVLQAGGEERRRVDPVPRTAADAQTVAKAQERFRFIV